MVISGSNLSYINSGSPQTRSTNELTMITGSGVNYSMTNSYYPRDWNGRVYYHYGERLQGDCSSGRFPVTAYLSDVAFESIADTIIDILDTLTITSTQGMTNYQWTDGSTEDTLQFIASQYGTGIHFVMVSAYDSLSCFHMDTVIVAVADLVSIDEIDSPISIFPNPTTGVLHLSSPTIDFVEVLTLDGKKLNELSVNNGAIDLTHYPSGFYLLRLRSHNNNQVIKILKRDQ